MLFSQALQGYWLDKKLELAKGSIRNYTYALNVFKNYVGDKEVSEITSNDIKAYLVHLTEDRKVTRRTASTNYVVLASFFSWYSREFIVTSPMDKVSKPKFTVNQVEPFTALEIKSLLSAKQPDRVKLIQMVLLDTGLRVSELCNLKVHDYDTMNGRLFIRLGKGSKDRIVYLGQKTQKLLWRYLQSKSEGYIFGSRTGKPCHRNNVAKSLKKVGKPLNIEVHPHKYRHTFAITFLRNGGNLKQLKELMGHSSLKTLEVYLSLAEVDLEQSRNYSPVDNL